MPRVLIIEDSPTQAQQLALILEDAGFDVETAPDAEHGFARLAAARPPGPIALVLTDLNLPGESPFNFFLDEAKVGLNQGSMFGAPGDTCVRLNFAIAPDVL